MKKGKWNYTEEIEYSVILVKLLPVSHQKLHWQNAFANTERQVVVVKSKGGHQFWIDNQDGSGLLKISKRGSPDSYHASVSEFEFIRELKEDEWQYWDEKLYLSIKEKKDNWMKENYPEDYEKILALRAAINKKNFK